MRTVSHLRRPARELVKPVRDLVRLRDGERPLRSFPTVEAAVDELTKGA
jgi:hypothetical protein